MYEVASYRKSRRRQVKIIDKHKKEGKEVPVAMQAIWDYEHEKMIDNAKEVKMLISMYKE